MNDQHQSDDPQLKTLVESLKNGVFRAVDALSQLGKKGVEPLIEALDHSSPAIPFRAAKALGELGDARAVKPLQRHLGSKNTSLGAAAGVALARLGEPGKAALLESVCDPNPHVRADAVYGFKELSLADDRVFEAFVAALNDPSDLVRIRAAESANDPRAVEPLIARLPKDIAIWHVGVWPLVRSGGPRVIEFFLVTVNDQTIDVRLRSRMALDMHHLQDSRIVGALIAALDDTSSQVRGCAVFALGELGDPQAIPALQNRLSDTGTISHHREKQRVSDWAAQALDKLRAG
jgi:HEAT repeat protein